MINLRVANCYRDTLATMEGCWIGPRNNGYLAFQEKAGDLVEAHLRGHLGEEAMFDGLEQLHAGH